jgi:hypothetical protein
MLPYWLFFAFFALGALIAQPELRPGRHMGMLAFGSLLLVIMIGLRDRVGVDWVNYLHAWQVAGTRTLGSFLDFSAGDPVFYTILWVLRSFDWPFWSLNLIFSLPFVWGLVTFSRQQPNPWLAIAIAVPYLVIVIAMSTTRQATAIGFVFLALVAFKRGNNVGFIIWIMIAAAFHSSAIVVMPFAGLSVARNRFQSIALILITAVAAYFTFGSTFSEYTRDYLGRYTVTSSGTIYRIVMNIVPAAIYLLAMRRLPFPSQERILWRNFSLLAFLSVPLLYVIQSSTALDRILLYAFPLQIMMLSWTPYLFKGRVQQIAIIFLIMIYLAIQQYVFFNFAVNADAHLPYRNILFSD